MNTHSYIGEDATVNDISNSCCYFPRSVEHVQGFYTSESNIRAIQRINIWENWILNMVFRKYYDTRSHICLGQDHSAGSMIGAITLLETGRPRCHGVSLKIGHPRKNKSWGLGQLEGESSSPYKTERGREFWLRCMRKDLMGHAGKFLFDHARGLL
jgi:hypothetical protein